VVIGTTGTGYSAPSTGADPHRILRNMSNSPASWVSLTKKLAGPSFIVSTACSSGAYALAAGFALIQAGLCDLVVAGAADSSLNYLDVQGFASLLALSEQADRPELACKPFDKARSGFVMGEGAGMLVLERLDHARSRGARIYAEMPLPGLSSESYNILSPEPGGVGMARSMRLALAQAGLTAEDIGYVNAHGTSTELNDWYESQAIRAVFGERTARLPVSSTKSVTGHCLAGAAGVEAVISCKALAEDLAPPTGNLTEPDPKIELDLVRSGPRHVALRHVMSNAFAFGGHNGVCIFSRPS
jgi:3-oxoacyl-[acyl-carrier-protein] synthase II